jgi:hypothetical protein
MEKIRDIARDAEDIEEELPVFTLLLVLGVIALSILLSGLVVRDTVATIQRRLKRTKNA